VAKKKVKFLRELDDERWYMEDSGDDEEMQEDRLLEIQQFFKKPPKMYKSPGYLPRWELQNAWDHMRYYVNDYWILKRLFPTLKKDQEKMKKVGSRSIEPDWPCDSVVDKPYRIDIRGVYGLYVDEVEMFKENAAFMLFVMYFGLTEEWMSLTLFEKAYEKYKNV